MFEGFNEVQETYNAFKHQYDILHDHNKRRNEATRDFDNLVDWKRYIKDIPADLLVLEKGKIKRIQVSIETWESVFELVDSIIEDG